MNRTLKRTLSAAAGLAAAAGLGAAAVVALPGAAAAGGGLDRFYQQRLDWKACALGPDDEVGKELDEAGARCADVTVPLDYSDPGGRTITVGISRIRASGDAPRIGTMILNGGGPGAALDMPPWMREIMGEAGPRYDLVGLDPRSFGRSAPVDCGWPASTWVKGAGETRRSFAGSVAFARDLAERCAGTDREILRNISTRNIARDIDVVRGALGEPKISYSGASYGTYLGAVYAAMFPGRLDRVVLDSSVDPGGWGPRLLAGTEGANERALAGWAAWAARRHDEYGLGRTRAQVLAGVREIIAEAAREPLAVGGYRVDETIVPVLLFVKLDTDEDAARASLAEAVRILARAADRKPAEPNEELDAELGFLLTGAESAAGSGQSAIVCGDATAPRDPELYWRDIQRHRAASPVFAPVTRNIGPCAFWPERPAEPPTKIGGHLPAMMVAATGDTRTTYESNLALHRLLRGSRMITLDAAVHAPYQRGYPNKCVTDRVNRYLVTGKLPSRDLTCPPEK